MGLCSSLISTTTIAESSSRDGVQEPATNDGEVEGVVIRRDSDTVRPEGDEAWLQSGCEAADLVHWVAPDVWDAAVDSVSFLEGVSGALSSGQVDKDDGIIAFKRAVGDVCCSLAGGSGKLWVPIDSNVV